MTEKNIWRKARKKPEIVEFREVEGDVKRIWTKEGMRYAHPEIHFIIRNAKGEIYPIRKEIFYKTYEIIEE